MGPSRAYGDAGRKCVLCGDGLRESGWSASHTCPPPCDLNEHPQGDDDDDDHSCAYHTVCHSLLAVRRALETYPRDVGFQC